MVIDRPYFRTVRLDVDDSYRGQWQMVRHPSYCERPDLLTRSFLILQEDILVYFRYVEPSDANLESFSLKGAELLTRACVEVEANLKSILMANDYNTASKKLGMTDYKKVNASHYLSQYRVQIPLWSGAESIRRPFEAWSESGPLAWYQAYNAVKHDRAGSLHLATMGHLVDAWSGLAALLTSQFLNEDFMPGGVGLEVGASYGRAPGFETCVGEFLAVQKPAAIPPAARYDFGWEDVAKLNEPFQPFDYSKVL